MIAAPLIARLLLANALKVSCVPPEVAVTWPASGTGAPPGTPGPAAWPAGSGTVSAGPRADQAGRRSRAVPVVLADDHPVVREGLRGMLTAEPARLRIAEPAGGRPDRGAGI